jgi:hypothetical protein
MCTVLSVIGCDCAKGIMVEELLICVCVALFVRQMEG